MYRLVVSARSTISSSFNQSGEVTVTVGGSAPLMTIDAPGNGSTSGQPLIVAGWALDRAAASGPGVDAVHVWAYPISGGPPLWVGADYGRARTDVAAAYGSTEFTNSGFRVVGTDLPAGTYHIVAAGRSTVTGAFDAVDSVTVSIY